MTLRRTVQIILFLLFLGLLVTMAYREQWGGLQPYLPPGLFLLMDPLTMFGTSLAERNWVDGILLVLPLILATALLGRIFCGWICPLGTSLDIFEKTTRAPFPVRREKAQNPGQSSKGFSAIFTLRGKYYLLLAMVAAALLGVQLFWIGDPIPIVTRAFTTALIPALEWLARFGYGPAQQWDWSASAWQWFDSNMLSFQQRIYTHSLAVFAFFLVIVLFSLKGRRWWCRNLCPLGALLGILSWKKPVRIRTLPGCTGCGRCVTNCKMEAISIQSGEGDENIVHVDNRECIMCSTCIEKCPQAILGYDTGVPDRQTSPQVDLPRRRLAGALAAGALAAPVAALDFGRDTQAKAVLRPPNSVPEDSFLSLCIRCGACMKVCPTNALHPLLFENGLPEAFSPVMIPRYGYCSYDCNLCGQVCPTGAIPFFNLERKHARSQGVAVVNRNRCIPYVENRDCLVCEEHCPTSPKAIVVERVTEKRADGETFEIKRPVIRPERCVGCGICENKCPVSGMGAINVHPYSPQKWRKNIESAGEALPSGQEIETTENYGDDGNYGNTESNYGYGQ